jgi:hypothetical protein
MEQTPASPNPITWKDFNYIGHSAAPELPVSSDKNFVFHSLFCDELWLPHIRLLLLQFGYEVLILFDK